MSVILRPVFSESLGEAREKHYDEYVHGKILASTLEKLDEMCGARRVRPLSAYMYESYDDLRDLFGRIARWLFNPFARQWFDPRDGLTTVRQLLEALAADRDLPAHWEGVTLSLKELEALLEVASTREILFNLQAGS